MLTFRQFFLTESPDFAKFIVNGLQYYFKIGSINTTNEVCFTVLKNGEYFSNKDFTTQDLRNSREYVDLIMTDSSQSVTLRKKAIYTHIELRSAYIVKNSDIKTSKMFFKNWDELVDKIDFEGRAWEKDKTWFVSIHGDRQTNNIAKVFDLLNTFDFYLETKKGTRYFNKESYLPSATPLQQKSPQLQQRVEQLRRRLHLAHGNEKKAILSLLDYFDR